VVIETETSTLAFLSGHIAGSLSQYDQSLARYCP